MNNKEANGIRQKAKENATIKIEHVPYAFWLLAQNKISNHK